MPPKQPKSKLFQPDYTWYSPETHPTFASITAEQLSASIGLPPFSKACKNRLLDWEDDGIKMKTVDLTGGDGEGESVRAEKDAEETGGGDASEEGEVATKKEGKEESPEFEVMPSSSVGLAKHTSRKQAHERELSNDPSDGRRQLRPATRGSTAPTSSSSSAVPTKRKQRDQPEEDKGKKRPRGSDTGKANEAAKGTKGKGKARQEACGPKMCEGNMRCLNHLGMLDWVGPDAERKYLEAHDLAHDVVEDERNPDAPVGLRNLGNTCYANAFLQVWYRILPFRAGVYSCAQAKGVTAPVFQLALTFAGLQNYEKNVWDPTGLATALNLDKGEQQDASEFSKLFMDVLRTEFELQDDRKLKSLITDQFEGELSYETKCKNCDRATERTEKFLELEINLQDKKDLAHRLRAFLAPEILDGDNQYHCSYCDAKHDAERRTKLKRLPPTLHFSMMRFGYDVKTGNRRKSKASISYPPVINMGQYIDGTNEEDMFELRGVVEHRGTSAHHGHFVSTVYDHDLKNWFLCNDEEVELIKRPLTQLPSKNKERRNSSGSSSSRIEGSDMDVDNDPLTLVPGAAGSEVMLLESPQKDGVKKNGKKHGSKAKGASSIASLTTPKPLHSSNNAYMLVYERVENCSPGGGGAASPDGEVFQEIAKLNDEWEIERNEFGDKRDVLINQFNVDRDVRLPIMRELRAEGKGMLIFSPSLQKWIKQGLHKEKKATSIAKDENDVEAALAASDSEASDLAAGSAEKDPELEDVKPQLPSATVTGADDDPMDGGEKSESVEQKDANDAEPGPPSEEDATETIPLVCEHGAMDPRAWKDVKVISETGATLLQSLDFDFGQMVAEDSICPICTLVQAQARAADTDQETQKKTIIKNLKSNGVILEPDRILSRRWYTAWTAGNVPPSGSEMDACWAEVTCSHGNAKIQAMFEDDEVIPLDEPTYHQILSICDKKEVPAREYEGGDGCAVCQVERSIRVENKKEEIESAETEKKLLHELASRVNNPKAGVAPSLEGIVITTSFITKWRDFLKKPDINQRPDINEANSELYCECQDKEEIVIDANAREDWSAGIFALHQDEWDNLTALYGDPIKPAILITRPTRTSAWNTTSAACAVCRDKRRNDSVTFSVTVLELGPKQSPSEITDKLREAAIQASKEVPSADAERVPGRRMNLRQRDPALGHGIRPNKQHVFTVNKDDSVLSLKKQIESKIDVSPWLQRLLHDGTELSSDKTLAEHSVRPGDYLLVKEVDPDVMALDNDEHDVAPTAKRSKADGFGGTLLFGNHVPAAMQEQQSEACGGTAAVATAVDEPMPMPMQEDEEEARGEPYPKIPPELLDGTVVTCAHCTFDNAFGNEACEVCALPLG